MKVKIKTKADPRLEQYFDKLNSNDFRYNFVAAIRDERRVVLPKSESSEKSFKLSDLFSIEIIIETEDDLDSESARAAITQALGDEATDINFLVTTAN